MTTQPPSIERARFVTGRGHPKHEGPLTNDRNAQRRNKGHMNSIIDRIISWLMRRRGVYVVCRAKDGSDITDIEVYTDHDRAQARQQSLGVGDTAYAHRLIDDDIHEQRKPSDYRVKGSVRAER